jgi:alpha,alpha-trehalase
MTESNGLVQQAQESLMFFDSELFKIVQMSGLFTDGKTFADAIPKFPFNEILAQFQSEKQDKEHFNLKDFIDKSFFFPEYKDLNVSETAPCVNTHIETMWQRLEKEADQNIAGSLLPLTKPYIVPGGRFREIYYWDSYFTALGLIESNRINLVESMLANFIDLQSRYGCIPNGNRSYYLSRSQPPILCLLVELLLPFQKNKDAFLADNIQGLEAEYKFWMQGDEFISESQSESLRVVKMPDGSLLNRYWDANTTPRPESYREDIELSNALMKENADKEEFFCNIRAACESGWDFSSRWLADDNSLASIRTTRIVPIDLNCLLYKLEKLLSTYYSMLSDSDKSSVYRDCAIKRKSAIQRYMWSEEEGYFMDYDLDAKQQSPVKSLAGVLPLFVELASPIQADKISNVVAQQFLQKGGLITTVLYSSQQWDAPNGWAPLHWLTVEGLLHYKKQSLAEIIMQRWLNTVESYFKQTGKVMEKYNVCEKKIKAGGGEYDVQEGFGWTNGVYQAFQAHLNKSEHLTNPLIP